MSIDFLLKRGKCGAMKAGRGHALIKISHICPWVLSLGPKGLLILYSYLVWQTIFFFLKRIGTWPPHDNQKHYINKIMNKKNNELMIYQYPFQSFSKVIRVLHPLLIDFRIYFYPCLSESDFTRKLCAIWQIVTLYFRGYRTLTFY